MSEQISLFRPRRHTHLRLAAATAPGPRQTRSPGFGGSTNYSDRATHGRELANQVSVIKATHRRRSQSLGIDPELILVLETNAPLDPIAVERAGLVLLEIRSDRALVAFAADPELAEFVSRNDLYQQGSPGLTAKGNERRAKYEDLFDKIDLIRHVSEEDLVGDDLRLLLADNSNLGVVHRLEVHCWCPEDNAEARRRNDEVSTAITSAGGRVLHTSVRSTAGWSVVCCDTTIESVHSILATERVSWINVMPRPVLTAPHLIEADVAAMPLVMQPAFDAPIVAIIDSGLRSAHPLIAPAVVGVEFVGEGLGDGGDQSGHGTLVASIALYGPLEDALATGARITPAGRLISVRVLDRENRFLDDVSWPDTMLEAMRISVEAGAQVINLSLGDARRPYSPSRPTAVAALVDEFVREHPKIVVITCVGNNMTTNHDVDRLLSNEYIQDLLTAPTGGLLDPGTSALAITTGGLGSAIRQGVTIRPSAEKVPVGGPNLPSPHTRTGPGPMGAIKPELVAASGSVLVDTLQSRSVSDPSVDIVGAGGSRPDRLLATGHGTSYAAPIVSNAALQILSRYPTLNGNSVRALLLVGTEPILSFLEDDSAKARVEQRRLTGYGRLSTQRAASSDDHRVVLLSESSLIVDQVHFYSVPVPSTFRTSGGSRTISVALAFDPPTRVTRLDYLANKMSFQVFHGPTVADVRAAYVKADANNEIHNDVEAMPPELAGSQLNLQPSDAERSRGTNQFAAVSRATKVADEKPDVYIVAVRSLNRWDTPGAVQPYSLAIALERDQSHGELYAELRAELEPLVIEVETELEIE